MKNNNSKKKIKKILKKCLTDRAAEGNNKIRPEGHKPSGRTKK